MSTNPPSFSNISSHPSFITIFGRLQFCWSTRAGTLSITILTVFNNLFLLPLCTSVLYMSLKRWRQRMPSSHSDTFTYQIVILELMNVLGSTLSCFGVHTNITTMETIGIYLSANVFSGQMTFHILTCVERYVAVVHPITYVALKSAKGIRLRKITISYVWFMCLLGMGYLSFPDERIIILLSSCMVPIAVVFISFCSISVLCVLMRPGPGSKVGNRQQVDQSKMRAFHTIMAILSVLLLRFGGHICVNALYDSEHLINGDACAIWLADSWFCLPGGLVLPSLFLHRARKIAPCRDKK